MYKQVLQDERHLLALLGVFSKIHISRQKRILKALQHLVKANRLIPGSVEAIRTYPVLTMESDNGQ